jgi:fucose 4-O-acetylase-like acetyltransferase
VKEERTVANDSPSRLEYTPAPDRKKPPRISWIDISKGLAMILVFYGHLPGSGNNPWFPDLMMSREIVYYFHMPLFFVLSGLTMRLDGDFGTFVWKRFRRLIVPYYVFSLYALGKIALKLLSPSTFASFHSKGMSGP